MNLKQRIYNLLNSPNSRGYYVTNTIIFITILAAMGVTLFEIYIDGFFDFGTIELYVAEWIFFIVFGTELVLRLISYQKPESFKEGAVEVGLLLIDMSVVISSFIIISSGIGGPENGILLWVLRILRLFRVMKLFRKTKILERTFGRRVFTAVFSDIIVLVGLLSVFSFLGKTFPNLWETLDPNLTNTGVDFLYVGFTLLLSIPLGMAFMKSRELKNIHATLVCDIRALVDDFLEFPKMKDFEVKELSSAPKWFQNINPVIAEKIILNFLSERIAEQQYYKDMDNWFTRVLRAYRDQAGLQDDIPAFTAKQIQIATIMGNAILLMSTASHHYPRAMYNFGNVMCYSLLIMLAYTMSVGIGGIPVVVLATLLARGLVIITEDTDYSLDPEKSMFNTKLSRFPTWPSRT